MSKLLGDTKVRIDGVRASYEHLLRPSAFPGAEEKFSVSAIIDKGDTESIKLIEEAIKAAEKKGVEKFGDKFAKAKSRYNPLHDGDVEKEEDAAYENSYYINASNKIKPAVLDASTGLDAEESAIYSGMYGKVIINFFPYYSSSTTCGVSASLLGFQKTAEGESLGGARVKESDFDDDEDFLN